MLCSRCHTENREGRRFLLKVRDAARTRLRIVRVHQ
jgi:hypothetical protein